MLVNPKKLELCLARACKSELELRETVSPQTLLRIRKGVHVKPKTVGRIARALNVDVTEIIEDAATADNEKQ